VRVGLHTGPAEVAGGRYVGLAVHRAARLCAVGHGGQILISQATVALLEDDADDLSGIELRDLGEHRLKDFDRPVRIYQLLAPGLESDSPPLRTAGPEPEPASVPAIRASDADRERTMAALREHTALGRLTLEEFSERVEKATTATTLDELDQIGLDLPPSVQPERPRRRPKRFTGVFFSDTERTGRWRLPRFSFALVFVGNADLDLRQAELGDSEVSFTAFMLFGNIDLTCRKASRWTSAVAVIRHRREHGRDVPRSRARRCCARIFSLFGSRPLACPDELGGQDLREIMRATKRASTRASSLTACPPASAA
jgi:hypothetical protein